MHVLITASAVASTSMCACMFRHCAEGLHNSVLLILVGLTAGWQAVCTGRFE